MKTLSNTQAVVIISALLICLSFTPAQTTFDKISVREFEVLDTKGVSRASIRVEEGGDVVFRLKDQQGTIRVKLGGNTDGAGLVMLDGDTEPAVHILAKKAKASVTLTVAGKSRDL